MDKKQAITLVEFYSRQGAENLDIDWPDIYFTPEYGYVCEASDHGSQWECCRIHLSNGACAVLVYLRILLSVTENCESVGDQWRLLTPYGYAGGFWETETKMNPNIWWSELRQVLEDHGCKGDIIIRQNPYIPNKIDWDLVSDKEVKQSKKLYFIGDIKQEETMPKRVFTKTRRQDVKMGHKNRVSTHLNKQIYDSHINAFVSKYQESMIAKSADKYYLFNNEYFKRLADLSNKLIPKVKNKLYANVSLYNFYSSYTHNASTCKASAIILNYKKYSHYHLSYTDHTRRYLNTFMIAKIWDLEFNCPYVENGKLILGCGITDGDGLAKFKKEISNKSCIYSIYSL